MIPADLDTRIDSLASQLQLSGKGTIELPELIDLENKVRTEEMVEVLEKCRTGLFLRVGDKAEAVWFHPVSHGVLEFHFPGVGHLPYSPGEICA